MSHVRSIYVLCLRGRGVRVSGWVEESRVRVRERKGNFPFLDFSNLKSAPTSSFFRSPKYNIPPLEARPGPPANIEHRELFNNS